MMRVNASDECSRDDSGAKLPKYPHGISPLCD
jgi:hypothetical protein